MKLSWLDKRALLAVLVDVEAYLAARRSPSSEVEFFPRYPKNPRKQYMADRVKEHTRAKWDDRETGYSRLIEAMTVVATIKAAEVTPE